MISKFIRCFIVTITRVYGKIFLSSVTILSNNCIAGFLYNRYGMKFMSPTINMQMSPKDFLKYIDNLEYYNSLELCEVLEPRNVDFKRLGGEEITFPVGRLGDLIIYFQHYKSFEIAKRKWHERKKRILSGNRIKVVLVDTACTKEDVEKFSNNIYDKVFITFNSSLAECAPANLNTFLMKKEVTEEKWWFDYIQGDIFGRKYFEMWSWIKFLSE